MDTCKCSKAEFGRESSETLSAQPERTGLVPIEHEPIIGETPQATLQSWLTPNPLFYIRNHYSIPQWESSSEWELTLDGHVDNTLSFSQEISQFSNSDIANHAGVRRQ